uniref:G_PROTEIN_RECEP_F1_2 domain-containing protein n=1 Tax=Steinernema glaseri TaxID=37863 RepID=A0A1I7Y978_9BILA
MDGNFSLVYNRLLIVTAVGSISVKPFCIYILIRKTPKVMRTVSYFLLNELLWNFTGNLLYTFGNPVLMLPAMCFRMDGIAASWLKKEEHQSFYATAICVTVMNFCVGFLNTFAFHYITLAYRKTLTKFHKAWMCVFCLVLHLILSLVTIVALHTLHIPVREYPEGYLPDSTLNVFCYKPKGIELFMCGCIIFVSLGIGTFLLVLFVGLSVRELWIKKTLMEKRTLQLQKDIMKNLLTITGIAVFSGSVPIALAFFYFYNNKLPYARIIINASILLMLNFGTLYAILILSIFKTYRKAVIAMATKFKKLLYRAFRVGQIYHTTPTNTAFEHVNNVRY